MASMKYMIVFLCLFSLALSVKMGRRKQKTSFLKFCPPVPPEDKETSVQKKCKTFYNLGVEIVEARRVSGNKSNLIIQKIKCITQQFTPEVSTITTVCMKKGMVDRAIHYQTEEALAARRPKSSRRGGLSN